MPRRFPSRFLPLFLTQDHHERLKWAGLTYLILIMTGVSSDMMFRQMALTAADPTTAALALRVSLVLDTAMLMADVVVALLLFFVFQRVNRTLATNVTAFRLVQGVLIGASLMLQLLALRMPDMTAPLLAAQADGYDLALLFFAVNTGGMAVLLCHSGIAPKALPALLMGSAVVYAAGGLTSLLTPDLAPAFEPAYALPLVAESWFCLWLIFGRRQAQQVLA